MKVLVTGGAGYIGSTTCSALTDAGHTPIILDSLVKGKKEYTEGHMFYHGDISDDKLLGQIFQDHPDIDCCIHFAARIIVPESVAEPALYYHENVVKSLALFSQLNELGCKRIIFSSSASIYDTVPGFMVTEQAPLNPSSPYARTKYMMEMILQDLCRALSFRGIALRYFNPIGADPAMRTGPYDPHPSHAVGKMVSVAMGYEPMFQITGTDWPTRDGSGIRDYIHVWDLARAHVLAVEKFDAVLDACKDRYAVINLGTGNGVTVKELVTAFEHAYGKEIRKEEAPAAREILQEPMPIVTKRFAFLGWKAEKSIEQGITDALQWADKHRKDVLGY